MSPSINSSTSNPSGTTTDSTSSATPVTDPLASESTFLTLLVSQLQNQDPSSPMDSNQFVSQLTEYSQLEQLIGIHQNTSTLATPAATTTGTSTSTTQPTTGA